MDIEIDDIQPANFNKEVPLSLKIDRATFNMIAEVKPFFGKEGTAEILRRGIRAGLIKAIERKSKIEKAG